MQIENTKQRPFLKVLIAILIGWTLLLAGIMSWNLRNLKQATIQLAEYAAIMSWEKDIVYRLWGARHGGVYVPVSQYASPNPHLKVKHRDVLIGGREYTLVNPAFMTRQAYDIMEERLSIRAHITSLDPIRPENAADAWEERALQSFERGAKEYKGIVLNDGVSHLRLMRPFITKEPCLKCHAEQGYKVGDVRGGISITVPMKNYQLQYAQQAKQLWAIYLIIWLAGTTVILLLGSTINRTINRLSKSQKQTASILDNIDATGLGVYIVDGDFRIRHMNDTMRDWCNQATGDICYNVIRNNEEPCDNCNLEQIIKNGENSYYERHIQDRIFSIVATPITLQDGTVAKMEIRTDITDQRQSEKDLIIAKEAADTANQAKSKFLANMSHEIRTPMNSIIGRTHLALDNELDADTRAHLDMISSSADNLLALINDILDFSKIEAGELRLENKPFDLLETVDSCLKTIHVLLDDKDVAVELRCSISPDVPQAVKGDALRLRQVLLNLLANSVKFTEEGSIDLFVDRLQSDDDLIRVFFKVQDSGIGIAPEKMEHIFEQFSQVDDTITKKYGGTGLGLAICRQLCQLMGGDIEVDSMAGNGTAFTFTLCLQPADSNDLPLKKEQGQAEQIAPPSLSILLVEDNEPNRILARMVLEKGKHKIIEAHDGLQALDLLVTHEFDAVVMDVQMPVMDGLTATRIIRKAECGENIEEVEKGLARELTIHLSGGHIPIIAITANAMSGDREECLASGMDDYLAKPFNPEDIASVFNKLATGHFT